MSGLPRPRPRRSGQVIGIKKSSIFATMAYTIEDLNNLKDAIKEGVLEVEYSDKKVKYRSLAEMFQIKDMIEQELGMRSKGARIFTKFNKGLG
jgi:hypothetical protein